MPFPYCKPVCSDFNNGNCSSGCDSSGYSMLQRQTLPKQDANTWRCLCLHYNCLWLPLNSEHAQLLISKNKLQPILQALNSWIPIDKNKLSPLCIYCIIYRNLLQHINLFAPLHTTKCTLLGSWTMYSPI